MADPRSRRLLEAAAADLTYAEVGATGGELPAGYRHVHRLVDLGEGPARFAAAAERLLTWQVHRAAGLTVEATRPRAVEGAVVLLGVGVGALRVRAPCRVVVALDEPRRRGFAYGTLPGHPETGEELFALSLDDRDRVLLQLTAFSRPATRWARLGAPVGRHVQDRITDRYVAALRGR